MTTDASPRPLGASGRPTQDGGSAGSAAAEAAGQAQQSAQEAVGQAQQSAQQVIGQAQTKVREQLDQRSSQAAGQINEQAADLRSVSQALREQGKEGPAQAADRLAGYAERVGGYLRDKDADALLADAEEFGRRRPWAAVGGGLAVGFAASRFIKASSSQRYQTKNSGQLSSPGTTEARRSESTPEPPVATPPVATPPVAMPPVAAERDAISATQPIVPAPGFVPGGGPGV